MRERHCIIHFLENCSPAVDLIGENAWELSIFHEMYSNLCKIQVLGLDIQLLGAQASGCSAVHDEGLAGHESRTLVVRQIVDRLGNLFRQSHPPKHGLAS